MFAVFGLRIKGTQPPYQSVFPSFPHVTRLSLLL
jgi:hypothetical protein